ncbi:hypothetical protein AcV7_007464 [Taiwanofungus camphoratus]|nr:hypothetical protein AcV7_007464 [Antrodia cinnamomea]
MTVEHERCDGLRGRARRTRRGWNREESEMKIFGRGCRGARSRDRDAHRCAHKTSQDEHSACAAAAAHTRICAAHRCKARASDRKYRAAGRAANSSRKAARPPSEMMSDGTREEGGT